MHTGTTVWEPVFGPVTEAGSGSRGSSVSGASVPVLQMRDRTFKGCSQNSALLPQKLTHATPHVTTQAQVSWFATDVRWFP